MDEVPEGNASQALLAVRLYTELCLDPSKKDLILETLQGWLDDSLAHSNPYLLIMGGLIYNTAGQPEDALRCLHSCLNLEMAALMVEILLKMDRPDVAEKTLRKMNEIEDDATLTQLAQAWVNMAQGGSKVHEAFYIIQEIGEKYQWTPRLGKP